MVLGGVFFSSPHNSVGLKLLKNRSKKKKKKKDLFLEYKEEAKLDSIRG